MLSEKKWMLLDEVFRDETKIRGVVTCFLALLELVKQNKISVSQDDSFAEVKIYLLENEVKSE